MTLFTSKKSRMWFFTILIISFIASIIGAWITGKNNIGSAILSIIIISIPLLIEIFRGKDPIVYYGLDFNTLRSINLKLIFSWAVIIFSIVSIIDFFVFNLWHIISVNKEIAVGIVTLALARSKYFYLGIVVIFSGTLQEELWFRGIIQHKINNVRSLRFINPHFGIFLQSIMFGLIHFLPIFFGTDFQLSLKLWFFIYPFSIAIIIGYLNNRFKSLWPGWLIHYTNNLLSLILFAIISRIKF